MLRSVRLKNFNRFFGEKVLRFDSDERSYFFVGENGSGKTSVFEAVKRCLGSKRCKIFDHIGNPDHNCYIICKFQFPSKEVNNEKRKEIISIMFHLLDDNPHTNYKVAVKVIAGRTDSVGIDKIQEDSHTHVITRHVLQLDKNDCDTMCGQLLADDQSDMQPIFDILKKKHIVDTTNESTCEQILAELDDSVVVLLERQSFSSFPWNSEDDKNQERADIIKWYRGLSLEEKEEEMRYFRIITDNFDYEFRLDEKQEKIIVKESGKIEWDFLRTPGGFVEAKQCSILLAGSSFHTLCLEEVAKGMHVQMIHRLRDFVLPTLQNKEKIVILATHAPSLLSLDSLPNTFIFQRRHKNDCIQHNIIVGEEFVARFKQKASRILTDNSLTKLFFCRKALFVEGRNDYILVRSLIKRLFRGESNMLRVTAIAQSLIQDEYSIEFVDPDVKLEQRFLAGLAIVQMDGSTQIQRMLDACNVLEVKPFFLLDQDALYKDKAKTQLIDLEKMFGLAGNEFTDEMRTELMLRGIFVCRDGDLEHMVAAMFETESGEPSTSGVPEEEALDSETFVPAKLLKTSQATSIAVRELPKWCNRQITKVEAGKTLDKLNIPWREKHGKSKPRNKLFASSDDANEGISTLLKFACEKDDLIGFVKFLVQTSRVNR